MSGEVKPINPAAIRHLVLFDLETYLPQANLEETYLFMSNLAIGKTDDMRFLGLRVSPENMHHRLAMIEDRLNAKYGERLEHVPGFYRRSAEYPFHVNLPKACALYFYGERYNSFGQPKFYTGVLCQPLERRKSHFLLSSAKYNGPRAAKLSPADNLYFTQYEEAAA